MSSAWDVSIDGSELDHRQAHDALHKIGEQLTDDNSLPLASQTVAKLAKLCYLDALPGSGGKVPIAQIAPTGTAGANKLVSADQKLVFAQLQYRDFEIPGNLFNFASSKRLLWGEDVTLVAIVLWLDTINAGGNTVLDMVKQTGASLLDASKITFTGGSQSLTVTPDTTAVAATDRLQFKVTAVGGTPGANLSGTLVFRPVLRTA